MAPPNWFIALPLDARELPDGELDSLPPGTRRFHPDDLHVTVAFLGPVERATALRAWSETDWSRQTALRIPTGQRATFGPRRRPSAFGLELDEPGGRLAAFIECWRDRLLVAAGRPPEERAVRPHVTLGRPSRGRGDSTRVRDWLAASPAPVPVSLDRVVLCTRAGREEERRFSACRECRLDPRQAATGDVPD